MGICPLMLAHPHAGRLIPEGIAAVVDHCIATGAAEWLDSSKASLRVFYRSPAEWASLIHAHCSTLGYLGQVLTMYELHSGTVGMGRAWEGVDPAVLLKAMEVLEGKNKAIIMRAADVDETAVKLLP
jgi:ESCRT-II complex subunit VPS25